jgi:hypothetical protein
MFQQIAYPLIQNSAQVLFENILNKKMCDTNAEKNELNIFYLEFFLSRAGENARWDQGNLWLEK